MLHIQSIDLNLLRVFDVLLEERSVTRVGARLGLSQSAVSHALNRLRHSLDDELFIRTARGMTPTERARELGPRVHAALGQLQSALTPSAFHPATTERRFVLVTGAYACAVLVPTLVAQMREHAPNAQLAVVAAAPDLLEQIDSQRADFIIGSATNAPHRLAKDTLLTESLAWVVRAENPLAQMEVTLDDLLAAPHVIIANERPAPDHPRAGEGALTMRASWEDFGAFETELQMRGLKRRIGVIVPDAYSALAVVRRSDMAALVPRRLALMSAQSGFLKLIEPPYQSPTLDLGLLYVRERLTEPSMAWMRDLVRETAAEL
ncbi:LysR family transcriptional regulator [soil metagenome]